MVQNRIDLLKHFNPDMEIHGMFGGKKEEFETYKKELMGLDSIYYLDIAEYDTKWRFSDYCILTWYKDFGHTLSFDVVHTIEYDLVILDSLEIIYPYAPGEKHIYLTGLAVLDEVKNTWDWFTDPVECPVDEENAFVKLMKSKYGLQNLYACLAPGATLTREYLEGYAKLNLPLIAHDEVRYPAIAQILNIPMKDTNFDPTTWEKDDPLFNCNISEVTVDDALKAYKAGKRKVFHAVYGLLNVSEL